MITKKPAEQTRRNRRSLSLNDEEERIVKERAFAFNMSVNSYLIHAAVNYKE